MHPPNLYPPPPVSPPRQLLTHPGGALFDLSAPDHAANIYHHIRLVHNFLSRAPTPASNPHENFFNRDTTREADHKHQMNRLAHARAGLPTPDKRKRQSVWEPGFGVRFEGEAGGRWRCAACKFYLRRVEGAGAGWKLTDI